MKCVVTDSSAQCVNNRLSVETGDTYKAVVLLKLLFYAALSDFSNIDRTAYRSVEKYKLIHFTTIQ